MRKATKPESTESTTDTRNTVTEQLLTNFKEYLTKDKKSPTTIASYLRDVSGYLQFVQTKPDQAILSANTVHAYRESMIQSSYKAATINTKLNSLHSFNKCLVEGKAIPEIVVDVQSLRITNSKLLELRSTSKS